MVSFKSRLLLHLEMVSRPAYQLGCPGSSQGHIMQDLWWTNRHWGRFSPDTSISPVNRSIGCSTLIIIIIITIHHPGLVRYAKQWPMYQVDSV
jgi:hypothetical protein